jgi:hypothetical protein
MCTVVFTFSNVYAECVILAVNQNEAKVLCAWELDDFGLSVVFNDLISTKILQALKG